MKKQRILVNVLAAALLAGTAGLATALDSQTLAVSAVVDGICKFSAVSTPLNFGTIDPSLATDKVMTANVLYKCTKGTSAPAVVTRDASMSRTLTNGVIDTMNYTLAFGATAAGTGFGSGQEKTLVVTGTITAANYQNKSAGTYAENVTLDITP